MKPIKIFKGEFGEKQWVGVLFSVGDAWLPSFREIAEILKLIGECEDEKYKHGKGLEMVIEFCEDATLGMDYEFLKNKYKLPK